MFSYTTSNELGGIFHVGTLDISQKSNQSLEWNGLSVSNCPNTWKRICGCAGQTWQLIPNSSDSFLLYHDLDKDDLSEIKQWAINAGYFTNAIEYRVYYYDDELEEERYFSFAQNEEQQAREEYEWRTEEDSNATRFEIIEDGLFPTDKLMQRSLVNVDVSMYLDIAVQLYAEEVLEINGIWWEDEFNPYALSAPRGVIFNSHLEYFDAIPID